MVEDEKGAVPACSSEEMLAPTHVGGYGAWTRAAGRFHSALSPESVRGRNIEHFIFFIEEHRFGGGGHGRAPVRSGGLQIENIENLRYSRL